MTNADCVIISFEVEQVIQTSVFIESDNKIDVAWVFHGTADIVHLSSFDDANLFQPGSPWLTTLSATALMLASQQMSVNAA